MQRATEPESRLAILVSAGLAADVPELEAFKAPCVLAVVEGPHLGVELRIEKQGEKPTREAHFAHEVSALEAGVANSSTACPQESQAMSFLSVGQTPKRL